MNSDTYDYAIVGAGAAGLQLALKMIQDPHFESQKILLIDRSDKTENDRTWSFWEKGKSNWDQIAVKTWQKSIFHGRKELKLNLDPFKYKTIRSADFYQHAKQIIEQKDNVEFVVNQVRDIEGNEIQCADQSFKASHIFDSRIDPEFEEQKHNYSTLSQHFKGWFIKTEEAIFDPETFTMMDYRLKWNDSTSFTYILPFSPTEALIEFTLFNQILLNDEEYDQLLQEYIRKYLKVDQFMIEEVEKGIIPMSDFPFHHHHNENVTKIGTAGGWVRPSSGYSFKNADRYTTKIIENIKKDRPISKGIANNRFRKYDAIFLKVLEDYNHLGELVFSKLYENQPVQRIFRFLDEESNLLEDIQVMLSLNHSSFRKAFFAKW